MINFVIDVSCQGMAISKLRVSVAEELSSSAEQLLRQKLVQSSIFPCTLLGGDPKHFTAVKTWENRELV